MSEWSRIVKLVKDECANHDYAESAIEGYLLSIRKQFGKYISGESAYVPLVVRQAHIEALLLGVDGIIDVPGEVTLNGLTQNITMASDDVPFLGEVTINA